MNEASEEFQNAIQQEVDAFIKRLLNGNVEIIRRANIFSTVPPSTISALALLSSNGEIVKKVPFSVAHRLHPSDELHLQYTFKCE